MRYHTFKSSLADAWPMATSLAGQRLCRNSQGFQMQSNTAFHRVALPEAWHPIPTEKPSAALLSVITGRKTDRALLHL